MTKRKLMLVALSLCMVAILAMGGTLAFFTDAEDVTNVFTVGDVNITLDEAPVKKDGDKWVPDTTADRTEEGNRYEDVYPGAVLPKDPTVHNVGTNDAYVRVQVQVNKAVLACYDGDGWNAKFDDFLDGSLNANWTIKSTIEEAETVTFVINYNYRLPAKDDQATTDVAENETTPVFAKIKVFEGWDNKEVTDLGLAEGTHIVILAEAIQAEGFVDADGNPDMDAAWAAFDEQGANN